MKKIILVATLAACSAFTATAQVRVNINIGTQPAWGPVGYDYVEYYYLPDADAYYDVNNRVFVYFDGRSWIHGRALPGRYGSMDLYHVHKVVINDRDPWMHHQRYHQQYYSYRGRRDQVIIRDSREERYWQNPGHPRYDDWRRGHDNGRGNNGTTIIDRRPAYQNQGNDNRGNDNREHGNGNRGNDNRGNDNREHGNGNNGNGGDRGHGNGGEHGNGGGDRGHGRGH
jgi:hypothetical protein